jgi:hypothetical protein
MATKQRYGGSFAPPLPDDKLSAYETLAVTADEQTREAMLKLATMVRKFRETPDSVQPGTPHPSGRGVIVPLEDAEIQRIWDVVPWMEELKMYGQLFEKISATEQRDLRNAAFHLLWFGKELCSDREPITNDKL